MLAHKLRRAVRSLTSLTFVTSVNGNSATKSLPSSGVAAGDLVLLYDTSTNASGIPASVVPSGFTTITNASNVRARQIISARIITSAGGSVTGLSGDVSSRYVAAAFHPNVPIVSFAISSPVVSESAGDPSAINIAAGSATSKPLILCAQVWQQNDVGKSTSPSMTALTVSSALQGAWYTLVAANGSAADQSVDCGDGGDYNTIAGAYLTFI